MRRITRLGNARPVVFLATARFHGRPLPLAPCSAAPSPGLHHQWPVAPAASPRRLTPAPASLPCTSLIKGQRVGGGVLILTPAPAPTTGGRCLTPPRAAPPISHPRPVPRPCPPVNIGRW